MGSGRTISILWAAESVPIALKLMESALVILTVGEPNESIVMGQIRDLTKGHGKLRTTKKKQQTTSENLRS